MLYIAPITRDVPITVIFKAIASRKNQFGVGGYDG